MSLGRALGSPGGTGNGAAPAPQPDPDDQSLMARVRDGDREAFRILLDRHWAPLVRYAKGFLDEQDDAEDVVQETFVRLWKQRESWTPSGALGSYIYRITRNLSLNVCRDRASRERSLVRDAVEFRYGAPPPTPEEQFAGSSLRVQVESAISSLSSRRREIFVLSRFHGLTHGEIAEAWGFRPRPWPTR
jgi:RNA polymerase sigma-70 factor, ECF subfamily